MLFYHCQKKTKKLSSRPKNGERLITAEEVHNAEVRKYLQQKSV